MTPLDQLLAFNSVASLGSFAAAATQLHKSQPAVTKLVQNLEAELGVCLFDRTAYRATLTDAGKLFFERAAQVVEDTEALRSFGIALGRGGEPVVRLVLEAVTPLEPVLRVLREVQSTFPSVRYELHTESLAGALEALRDARADLAITGAHGLDPAHDDRATLLRRAHHSGGAARSRARARGRPGAERAAERTRASRAPRQRAR